MLKYCARNDMGNTHAEEKFTLNTLEVASDKSVCKINAIHSWKITLTTKLVVTSEIPKLYGSSRNTVSLHNLVSEIGIYVK